MSGVDSPSGRWAQFFAMGGISVIDGDGIGAIVPTPELLQTLKSDLDRGVHEIIVKEKRDNWDDVRRLLETAAADPYKVTLTTRPSFHEEALVLLCMVERSGYEILVHHRKLVELISRSSASLINQKNLQNPTAE
ncbi:hypothetical protein COU80_04180 [Candidatus Peregrinibacteria bacterium CG10_big_fil_rev_8_21_14_0_10_55_24]|nr:MAG: hypothetical protein COU80_04180 [Candidatus Peregrinibacteria bacterium CG10_big_fil_rev_8_21_14_0_10_55_24]